MKNKEDVLTISPMTDYKVPELPTYEENKPDFTGKLPLRWKNKAMIAAVSGILGVSALTGCALFEQEISIPADCGEEEYWGPLNNFQHGLCIRSHYGGAVGTPIYVAHLTEQEALDIISTRLENAGLNFTDIPPKYYIEGFWRDPTIDLFDSQSNVGIVHASWLDSHVPFSARGRDFSLRIAEEFAEQVPDITVGAFNTPGSALRDDSGNRITLNASNAAEIRSELLEDLDEQIQEFIDQLQEEGIID